MNPGSRSAASGAAQRRYLQMLPGIAVVAAAAILACGCSDDDGGGGVPAGGPTPMDGPFDYGPEVVTGYAWDGSDFVEETRTTYTYDAGKVATILRETWDAGAEVWVNSILTTYAYNPDDTVDTVTVESWDGAGWVPESTTTCAYADGRMTAITTPGTSRTTFTYAGDLVTREETEEWDGAGWAPLHAENYAYDGTSRFSSGTIQVPNPIFPEWWLDVGTIAEAYDLEGRLSSQSVSVDAFTITGSAQTGPTTYHPSGRLLTIEMQVDDTVAQLLGQEAGFHTLAEYSYDGDGRLEEILRYDREAGDWLLSGRTTFTNTDAGSSLTFERERATPMALWPLELYGSGDVNPHLW